MYQSYGDGGAYGYGNYYGYGSYHGYGYYGYSSSYGHSGYYGYGYYADMAATTDTAAITGMVGYYGYGAYSGTAAITGMAAITAMAVPTGMVAATGMPPVCEPESRVRAPQRKVEGGLNSRSLPYNLQDDHADMVAGPEAENHHVDVELIYPWGTTQPDRIPFKQLATFLPQVEIGPI